MRSIGLFLFFQTLAACQQGNETVQSFASNLIFPTAKTEQTEAKKTETSDTNKLFKSEDGGQTWQEDLGATMPEDGRIVAMTSSDNGDIFLAMSNGELWRSENLPAPAPRVWEKEFLHADTGGGGSQITQLFTGRGGRVFASAFGGGFFMRSPGLPPQRFLKENEIRSVIETADGSIIASGGSCGHGIFKTADGGKTWRKTFDGAPITHLLEADGVLLASGFKGLLRSTDGGENWDWVMKSIGEDLRIKFVDGKFVALGDDKKTLQRSFLDGGATQNIFISADSGKTWQRSTGENLPADCRRTVKKSGSQLFSSDESGISRSDDGGKTWQLVRRASDNGFFIWTVSRQTIFATFVHGC